MVCSEQVSLFGEITYTFEDNGVVSMTMIGCTTQGTYTQQDEYIIIKLIGYNTITAKLEHGLLCFENGGLKTFFCNIPFDEHQLFCFVSIIIVLYKLYNLCINKINLWRVLE